MKTFELMIMLTDKEKSHCFKHAGTSVRLTQSARPNS